MQAFRLGVLFLNLKSHCLDFDDNPLVLIIVRIVLPLELILVQGIGAVLAYQIYDQHDYVLGLLIKGCTLGFQIRRVIKSLDHLFAVLYELGPILDELVVGVQSIIDI